MEKKGAGQMLGKVFYVKNKALSIDLILKDDPAKDKLDIVINGDRLEGRDLCLQLF